MRIAMIVGSFPVVSQTFIPTQIAGLLDRGCDVQIISVGCRGSGCDIPKTVSDYKMLDRTHFPAGDDGSAVGRIRHRVKQVVGHGWRHPVPVIRGLNPVRFGKRAFNLFCSSMALHLARIGPFDIVHVHFGTIGLLVMDFLDVAGCTAPLVVTYHGSDINEILPDGSQLDYRGLFDRAQGVTANSRFTVRRLIVRGCPSGMIKRIPMGTSMASFPVLQRKREANDPVRFLTVGRVIPFKGIDYVIRALPAVVEANADVEYHVVGPPNHRDEYMELARELGVDKHVFFHGAKPHHEIRDYLERCDVFVLAGVVADDGTVEAQGVVLAEAQATGMPVITTDVGGIPESTGDGRAGIMIKERDVEALSEAMLRMISMRDRWEELGQIGRKYVERKFGLDQSTDRLMRFYRQLVAEKQSAG